MPEYKLDMVREGIILYGLKPSEEVDSDMKYYPALELKSHVIFVKELPAGESVSYGRTYITKEPTRVATVAIGYADGYPRSLSNKGYVLIHGKKAPVIGRVCMDQMMVDVTGIDNVQVEDVVTVVGKDGEEVITFEELGKLADRFNYEFVCDISERVERKYIV
jgi:alanine racemase